MTTSPEALRAARELHGDQDARHYYSMLPCQNEGCDECQRLAAELDAFAAAAVERLTAPVTWREAQSAGADINIATSKATVSEKEAMVANRILARRASMGVDKS